MKLLLKTLVIILIIPTSAFSDEDLDTLWTRTYGGSGNEYGNSIKSTSDGGYIIAGATTSIGSGSRDVWLLKVDSYGIEEWNKTFGGNDNDLAYEVHQTNDEGYIIVGSTKSFGSGNYDIWLIKTDANGNEQWNQTFGDSNLGRGYSVKQTDDNGYILVGSGSKTIIKTDVSGIEIWSKSYNAAGYSVHQTQDNGYIVAGTLTNGGNGTWVVKLDDQGIEQWNFNDSQGGSDNIGWAIIETFEGDYVLTGIAGNNSDAVQLLKLNAQGTKIWKTSYWNLYNEYSIGRDVVQTTDGGFIILAEQQLLGSAGDMGGYLVIKTDSNGDIEWHETFGGDDYESAGSIDEVSEDKYIISGYSRSFGNGGSDVYTILLGVTHSGPTFHVSTSGSDSNNGSEDSPFATIQAGINAASDGDTVRISPGYFYECLEINKNVTIIGSGPDSTFVLTSDDHYCPGYIVTINSTCTLDNLNIDYNREDGYNKLILINDGEPIIKNNILKSFSNSDDFESSAIKLGYWPYDNQHSIISNNTFIYNCGSSFGGAANYAIAASANTEIQTTINNNIFYTHASCSNNDAYIDYRSSLMDINNNMFYGQPGFNSYAISDLIGIDGNINSDPLFTDPDNGDFTLQAGSPCIDAGDPNSALDPDGTVADMGAFYFDQSPIYVSATGSDSNDGSENSPMATIQAGLDAASSAVKVLEGEYVVSNNMLVPEGISLTLDPGVTLKFDADKVFQVKGKLIAEGTNGNKITFTSNEDIQTEGDWGGIVFEDESIDAIVSDTFEYISGSIIKSCIIEYAGPGIVINRSHPYIDNNLIQHNKDDSVYENSGGIRLYFAIGDNLIIRRNIFRNNHAQSHAGIGAGIRLLAGENIRIYNNIFVDNTAHVTNAYDGSSGIYIDNASGPYYVQKNSFINNSITGVNGEYSYLASAISSDGSNVYIENNLIANNNAQSGNIMGGVIIQGSTFQNNNVVGNSPYDISLRQADIDAENNYWGNSATSSISNSIYDFNDSGNLGVVDYDPFLTSPNIDAPNSPPHNVV
ncbi:DUF5123 domain-containing protein, partial [Candidatus Marinimicrobia bacterium]|nr:DUF5123 domain-containing protein [Candidatus Neomarinimicrobiota bacterium]